MKRILVLLFLIISISSLSQSKKTFFFGKIIDSTDVVINAHIINLKTKKGTFSNTNGLFSISAKEKDSLQITAIGYTSKIIVIKPYNFRENKNIIFLKKETYMLDEVILKKHNLSGYLSIDLKKTPVTYKEKTVEDLVSDIQGMDPYKISKMGVGIDEMHLKRATKVRLPSQRFVGFGITTGSSGPSKATLNSRKLEEYKNIPDRLLSEFGPHFFFTELKIPEDKYYHFITYCSYKNIFELYKKKKISKIINIIKKESKTYLKIIKNK